jgi:hypothetical protein
VTALRQAYKQSGLRGYWQWHIELLKEQSKRAYVSPIFIAMDYAELGERDQAFAWLGKAFEERSGWLLEVKVDPAWDKLRTDSRFDGLIQRVGITR